MSEIEQYDAAAEKFYSKLKINSLPIVSWDFFALFFDKTCENYNDIVVLTNLAKANKWVYEERFNDEIFLNQHVIVVTDAELNIEHATQNIFEMTGYASKEILGKKPSLFQGERSSVATKKQIATAIRDKKPFEVTITNYKKNGTTYNCWIKGEPIFDTSGKVVNFIAYEKEVA